MMNRRPHLVFLLLFVASLVPFWRPLRTIAVLSINEDRYSHLLFIPVISLYFLYTERARIFSQPRDPHPVKFWLPFAAALIVALAAWLPLGASERLALTILAMLVIWITIFLFCYGAKALPAAAFPLGFLLFMVPLPDRAVDWIVYALQSASADVSAWLFRALDMPSFRQGFRFLLPGVQIEVANECSGIRSTMALLLVSIVAGQLLLHTTSRKICLVLVSIPIGIFKNALRIVTLSYLGVYVDRAYLTGKLHHEYGGLVFSAVSLFLLSPVLLLLSRSESPSKPGGDPA